MEAKIINNESGRITIAFTVALGKDMLSNEEAI
jgi:hypothetical protein